MPKFDFWTGITHFNFDRENSWSRALLESNPSSSLFIHLNNNSYTFRRFPRLLLTGYSSFWSEQYHGARRQDIDRQNFFIW